MPRKGNLKVRTGCITCKQRKVKCDEAKPTCKRCSGARRQCEGYYASQANWISWERLLCLRSPPSPASSPDAFPGIGEPRELRALTFFRQAVAPTLCGPLDDSIWTYTVLQMTHREPAVCHAVLAISSLYENFDTTHPPLSILAAGRVTLAPERDTFAIKHYNKAIQHIVAAAPTDLDAVLLTCILFTCIDFLRGDAGSAITHSQHGISLLNSASVEHRRSAAPEITRVFQYLGIYPYFFGGTIQTFSELSCMPSGLRRFEDFGAARESLDWLLARTTRLVRASDYHRMGVGQETVSLEQTLLEQHRIGVELGAWWAAFAALSSTNERALRLLEARWLVCTVWSSCCLSPLETIFDCQIDRFQRVVDLFQNAEDVPALASKNTGGLPHKFLFDMGSCPLLFFVAMKCRSLSLRLTALQLLRRLPYARETLWDALMLYGVGKRIIEVEHDLLLPSTAAIDEAKAQASLVLPDDQKRVRDYAVDLGADPQAVDARNHAIQFRVLSEDGGTKIVYDVAEW